MQQAGRIAKTWRWLTLFGGLPSLVRLPSLAASVSAQHIRHVLEQPNADRVRLAGYAAADLDVMQKSTEVCQGTEAVLYMS